MYMFTLEKNYQVSFFPLQSACSVSVAFVFRVVGRESCQRRRFVTTACVRQRLVSYFTTAGGWSLYKTAEGRSLWLTRNDTTATVRSCPFFITSHVSRYYKPCYLQAHGPHSLALTP